MNPRFIGIGISGHSQSRLLTSRRRDFRNMSGSSLTRWISGTGSGGIREGRVSVLRASRSIDRRVSNMETGTPFPRNLGAGHSKHPIGSGL